MLEFTQKLFLASPTCNMFLTEEFDSSCLLISSGEKFSPLIDQPKKLLCLLTSPRLLLNFCDAPLETLPVSVHHGLDTPLSRSLPEFPSFSAENVADVISNGRHWKQNWPNGVRNIINLGNPETNSTC